MIEKEQLKSSNGRVTQGIPSLDPSKRFQKDAEFVSRDYHQKIEQERQEKEQQSIRPDGETPKDVIDISKGRQLTAEEFVRRLSALNKNLWFERSANMPSEMMLCLKVSVSEDYPKGLKYIGGFSADKPINERDWVHVKERWVASMGFIKKEKYQCHGCESCRKMGAIGGVVRGYRGLLKRLEDAQVITPAQTERMFGSGNTKNWKYRHGS